MSEIYCSFSFIYGKIAGKNSHISLFIRGKNNTAIPFCRLFHCRRWPLRPIITELLFRAGIDTVYFITRDVSFIEKEPFLAWYLPL